jgi:hypothetical protein
MFTLESCEGCKTREERPANTQQPAAAKAIRAADSNGHFVDALKNMTYVFHHVSDVGNNVENVKMINGKAAIGTTTYNLGRTAIGDLKGNGQTDAVVVIGESGGGSGYFEGLLAVTDDNGTPQNSEMLSLGDRVKINSLEIERQVITVDMITQGPNDPMCCPSEHRVLRLTLVGNQLVEAMPREEASDSLGTLITSNKDFAVCRVRELEFGRANEKAGQCIPGAYQVYCGNDSLPRFSKELQILSDAGYIGGKGHPITTHFGDSYPKLPIEYWWTPNDRGLAALGGDVREEKVGYYRNGMVAFKWELTLGCREFQQIDGTTPLADGIKADFSWHWKTTPLGAADKLGNERQRGVAYFTRRSDGMAIDQIHFDSNDRQ